MTTQLVPARRPLAEIAARLSDGLVHAVKVAFVVVVIVFLAANAIPAVHDRLKNFGILDEGVIAETVGIAFVLTVALLHRLDQQVGQLTRAFQEEHGTQSALIFGGVGEVFPRVRAAIQDHPSNEPKILEVLGLTLYATWPQVQAWLKSDSLRGWKIILTSMSPEFLCASGFCPPTWCAEAKAIHAAIQAHVTLKQAELSARNISVEFSTYEAFPAIHGFRVGEREVFISFEHWSETDADILDEPVHFYERIPRTDYSLRAQAYRTLFGNWIDHVKRSAATKSGLLVESERP